MSHRVWRNSIIFHSNRAPWLSTNASNKPSLIPCSMNSSVPSDNCRESTFSRPWPIRFEISLNYPHQHRTLFNFKWPQHKIRYITYLTL
jgi:hypothetical protein